MDRSREGVDKSRRCTSRSQGAPRFASHGSQLEQGKADLYTPASGATIRASRAARSKAARSAAAPLLRTPRLSCAAIPVRPRSNSPPADRRPFFNGTHYLAIQMLEGFVPRELIKLGRVPNVRPTGSRC